jgi:polyhydroxyalkanoate synthesis regulator phasin
MAPDLAGSQISALLETVPGIASVLRSPVADALINMIRAGAGLGEYRAEDAHELVQFAVRRGLIGAAEGDRVLQEVRNAPKKARVAKAASKRPRRRPVARKRSSKKRR